MSSQVLELAPPAQSPSTFLSLPVEIRLRIYTLLFRCAERLLIEPADPAYQQAYDDEYQETFSSPTWQMRMSPIQLCRPAYLVHAHSSSSWGLGLSSQLLLVCRQICAESRPIMYGVNKFDCSMRTAPAILSRVISTSNFALIRNLILDWEQLQDFAWSLAKDEQVEATRGLEVLQVNHFRTQLLRPSPQDDRMRIFADPGRPFASRQHTWLYENTKSHERQLHQAAFDICAKHAQLQYVLQEVLRLARPRGYQAEEVPQGSGGHGLSRPIPELKVSARIRWRFVTARGLRDRKHNESILDLPSELRTFSSARKKLASISS